MKRGTFIKHLKAYGVKIQREGRKHTIFYNPLLNSYAQLPRHGEIKDILCNEICKQL